MIDTQKLNSTQTGSEGHARSETGKPSDARQVTTDPLPNRLVGAVRLTHTAFYRHDANNSLPTYVSPPCTMCCAHSLTPTGPIAVKAAIWTVVEHMYARGIGKLYAGPIDSVSEVRSLG